MFVLTNKLQRRTFVASAVALAAAGLGALSAKAEPRSFATLAMIGEPQTLDPAVSTADLVGTIIQHVYETLYTFDENLKVVPMLAEGEPAISPDGRSYSITLRKTWRCITVVS